MPGNLTALVAARRRQGAEGGAGRRASLSMRTPLPPHEKSAQGSGSRRDLTGGGTTARVRAALDALVFALARGGTTARSRSPLATCFGAALAAFASAPAAAQTVTLSVSGNCGGTPSNCGTNGDRDTTWPGLQLDEGDNITFTATLSSSLSSGAVVVFANVSGSGWSTSDVSLTNGVPLGTLFTQLNYSFFSGGTTTQNASYKLVSDGVSESDETITISNVRIALDTSGQSFSNATPSAVTVTIRGTDAAPDFGTGSVPAKSFTRNTAITEFQIPAATGGNGAVTYAVSGLPAGLVFDADGTGSCPGTEPREICGTPTGSGGTVTVTARDADANTASTDEDTLTFSVSVTSGVTLASNPATLTEANLNGATLTVTLPSGTTFSSGVSASGTRTATLTLATGTGYGFNTPATPWPCASWPRPTRAAPPSPRQRSPSRPRRGSR